MKPIRGNCGREIGLIVKSLKDDDIDEICDQAEAISPANIPAACQKTTVIGLRGLILLRKGEGDFPPFFANYCEDLA